MSDVVEQFEREARGGRRGGLDPVRDELDALIAQTVETVRERSGAFWERYKKQRDPTALAAWFVPRCWREIDYVFMLGEVIRRYGLTFERRHITALSRQLLDEAEHCDTVGASSSTRRPRPCGASALGGRVEPLPLGQPRSPPARRDRGLEHERDRGHRHARGDRRGRAALRPAGRRARLRADHQGREVHVGLGRLLLDRYAENEADLAEIMRAMRGMAAITVESHVAIDPG